MTTTASTPTDSTQLDGSATHSHTGASSGGTGGVQPAALSRRRHALDRAFPTRDLFRGRPLASLLWAVISAVPLAGLLGLLLLMLHFLQSGGALELTGREAAYCNEWTGVELATGHHTNLGLRPVVWSARETIWGKPLVAMYRELPWLQTNWTSWIALLAAAVVMTILWRLPATQARIAAEQAAVDVTNRLRRSLHRQALRVGPGDLREADQQHIRRLFAEETEAVQTALSRRIHGIGVGGCSLLVLVVLALLLDWRATLQCLIPLGCGWYLFVRRRDRWNETVQTAQQNLDWKRRHLSEDFSKSRIIRGYGMENVEHHQFQTSLDDVSRDVVRAVQREEIHRWAGWGLGVLASTVALFFIGIKVLQSPDGAGNLTFASATFLLLTLGLLYFPLNWLSALPKVGRAAAVSAERIFHYLDRIPEVSQAVGAKFLQPLSNSLQFEAVHYNLPGGEALLRGVDLKLPAGQTVAFVSLNPLEARALAYMLPRFIEPDSGRILVDGKDIAWVTLESLRAEMTYVGGEAPWFSGSVLENIRCGDERRSLQEVTDAAKTVHAHKFISRLPQGYETVLGDSHRLLSDGEAFRLALARAMLQDPALLIIEEPAVSLDPDTKSLLDDAYNRILKGRTVIFLPARLSTVRRADTVVLLHTGRVEAIGTHSSLVKASTRYRHWDYINFNQFRTEASSA